jgi:hypothetical protein
MVSINRHNTEIGRESRTCARSVQPAFCREACLVLPDSEKASAALTALWKFRSIL